MSKAWEPAEDRALLAAAEQFEAGGWEAVGRAVSKTLGEPISADQARNRTRRIREQIALVESLPVEPFDGLELTDIAKDTYVGFKMAFFDIETTDLKAFMGRILCASISDSWGNITTRTIYDFPQASLLDDSGLAEWLRDELEQYDITVGWYSTGFDIPMLTARLLRWGKRPMRAGMHIDPIYKARGGRYGAKIGSSKLDNVAKFFRTPDQKTPLDWDTWQLAAAGDRAAMDLVVEHCEADVLVLRAVFNHLRQLITVIHR